jgi:PKD repeat protein
MKPAFLLIFLFLFVNLSFAQWSTDPAVNLDISTAAGEQAIPKIATANDGTTYICWFSNESGNYNVRLQKLDPYGFKLWADDGLLISDNTAMSWLTDFDMTVDAANHAIIVFQDIRTGSNNVFAYRISPAGAFVWGADGLQLSNSSAFDAAPKVTVTANGDAVVAWQADDVIIRQKISPSGTLLWGDDGITMAGSNTFSWPQLLPWGADNVMMKYFEDIGMPNAPDRYVYVQLYDNDGNEVWAQPTSVSSATGISAWTQIFPFLSDGHNGFYMAWHDDRDNNMLASVFVQHVDSLGVVQFATNGVEASTMAARNNFYAHLALPIGSDDVFVFWNEMDGNQNKRGIYGQKISENGSREWTNNGLALIDISPTNVYPIAARNSETDMIVIYEEDLSASNAEIKAMRVDVNGNFVWTGQFIDMCTVASSKVHDVANQYNNGQWIAVWEDDRNGTSDIYGQNIQLDGTLGSIPPIFHAGFIADDEEICAGGSVSFTDDSNGGPTSWAWSFEGGNPASSTDQNPVVSYASPGLFDVQLIISDGTLFDTLLIENYIEVKEIPAQADKPVGTIDACQNGEYSYSTLAVPGADSYFWEVTPSDAGVISGDGIIANFIPSTSFTGAYEIKVRAENECGDGSWSEALMAQLYYSPESYQLLGDGAFCEGSPGAELYLEFSDVGVDYELFLDDVTTGIILPGVDDSLSFGFQNTEGIYNVNGFTDYCSSEMGGQIWVHQISLPAQATQPIGPDIICNNQIGEYSTTEVDYADFYNWILVPSDAGIIIGEGMEITIDWDSTFNGQVSLTVAGENECGEGVYSDPLEINVQQAPAPVVSGSELVCYNQTYEYSTAFNSAAAYEWFVSGGQVLSGNQTNEISVLWTETGTGTVYVIETFDNLCADTSAVLEVIVDDCPGISETENARLSVFPNPARVEINVFCPSGISQISIFNNSGIKIYEAKTENAKLGNSITVKVEDYSQGIYLISGVSTNGNRFVGKFLKLD